MSQVINSNVLSLNAQRNLSTSGGELAQSLQRLSSGLRINSAKDDAAGLAISERFTTQIRGLNQAIRNSNDGISLSQTGEGALAELTNNLQRIRELAVQSANATNSSTDRNALNQEVQQRLAEIDRIATQTSFNGQNILDGSFGNASFQVGANVGETIGLDLQTSVRQNAIGSMTTATTVDLNDLISEAQEVVTGSAATFTFDVDDVVGTNFSTVPATEGTATFDGLQLAIDFSTETVSFEVTDGTDAETVTLSTDLSGSTVADIAAVLDGQLTEFSAAADGDDIVITNNATGATSTVAIDSFNADADGNTTDSTLTAIAGVTSVAGEDADTSNNADLVITDTDGTAITITLDTDLSADDGTALLAAINGALGAELTATLDAVAGTIALTDDANNDGDFTVALDATGITASESETGVADEAAVPAETLVLAADELTIQIGDADAAGVIGSFESVDALLTAVNQALGNNATASLDADTGVLSIVSGSDVTIGGDEAGTVFTATEFTATGSLETVNVSNVAAANDAIQRIDSALGSVSDLRSTFGAIQNRLESTIANLSSVVENLSASRSRILDTDFAAETAALTRAQVLQQAGVAMLSQANAAPQNVLALLR